MKNIVRCMLMLVLSSCAYGNYSEKYPFQSGFDGGVSPSFWTQKVRATIWGIYYISPYGPTGLGYVNYERNVDTPTKQPVMPGIPAVTVP